MEMSDEAAIAAAQDGNPDAFRVLVERYSRSVFRLAYRMTGNEQDAEDVVQEAFLRAYKQLHRYENRASFPTWVYRIAANYSLDLIRARRTVESETMLEQLREGGAGPDRLYLSGRMQETLDRALETLSQQERTAFVLRHFEGQSIDEIGGVLGIGNNAAKHSIFRAVQKLRKALSPWVSVSTT
ncbi:ECF RNA polymerase sigma factor SigW [Bryobacterales bacterium F-183]|nr:ECF RNA polymerase sigma factor SigW [Bryobacterales bacterium F-183]